MASQLSAAVPRFHGLRGYAAPRSAVAALPSVRVGRKRSSSQGIRCDYIGSATNLIMVTTTTLMLFAGRFGLAPSANRKATAGLKLEARDSGLQTGDPAGFTLADTLACGAVGHILGVGIVLGLKNTGALDQIIG
ncbi:photosystem I reaction center 6 [Zea mays]|uniref:Photosystem I reaction center subunit psaK, chloroplastic n=1 Tax=Zea mays TaxID=4577 RepID=B6TR16_MAIZE|nr:photosystem I reaction center 6 [Zea mays]ACG39549.1 photosystem I reaction center subunit psaK [Zea mays]ACG47323.1 photosystem I reaction center subunit psaK [Zea mays]ONM51361.1 photosystem I reaction center6 [Zea mays]5ZJI_K Chain K, Photosystem I reaction center subunit psaK [Zea mays]|eukprot:NP_001152380.1 photosystem I reaction center 6 [Zea mays]